MKSRFNICLLLGSLMTLSGGLVIMLHPGFHQYPWITSPLGLAYNLPITFVFLVLSMELIWSSYSESLRNNLPFLIVWLFGLLLLLLRVGFEILPVSGHLSWLVLMVVHSYLRPLPVWFTALIIAVLCEAAFINFVLFPQRVSGGCGIITGILLATVLYVLKAKLTRSSSATQRMDL